MAREAGLDLGSLAGTGPGGRIVKADVEAAAGGAAPAPAEAPAPPAAPAAAPAPAPTPPAGDVPSPATAKGEVRVEELSKMQQVVARRMAESRATIPDHTLTTEIDMERCVALRKEIKALKPEVVPSVGDMIVKACGIALREFPRANGAYRDGGFELYSRVNVGIAVAAQDSLVVPTIFDVDQKSLGEIAGEARELARRVRKGSVTPPELSGGTFTVFDLGMHGVTEFNAVINPPQEAILAVGALERRPVVHKGKVRPRRRMTVSLTCDHRILYGAEAADFLARIRALLERPAAAFAL
jgi:pyruvate dehydrogenase E2 component (dihydrolipoamide acetyltransferase)